MSKELPLPRWAVSQIRGSKPIHIATVLAKDAESAIAAVIKEHNITNPEQMKRIAARPA
jgi:hypothetical protein